jgi:hypothetical protein
MLKLKLTSTYIFIILITHSVAYSFGGRVPDRNPANIEVLVSEFSIYHSGDTNFTGTPINGHINLNSYIGVIFPIINNGPSNATDVTMQVEFIDKLGNVAATKSYSSPQFTEVGRKLDFNFRPWNLNQPAPGVVSNDGKVHFNITVTWYDSTGPRTSGVVSYSKQIFPDRDDDGLHDFIDNDDNRFLAGSLPDSLKGGGYIDSIFLNKKGIPGGKVVVTIQMLKS